VGKEISKLHQTNEKLIFSSPITFPDLLNEFQTLKGTFNVGCFKSLQACPGLSALIYGF
jgi:hypothetical protein